MSDREPPPEHTSVAQPGRLRPFDLAALVVLAVVTFAVYAPARHAEFVRYDDPVYVTRNRHVQAGLTLAGLRYAATAVVSSNWHPLTLVVEMFAVQLFGPSAETFHLLNDVLHAGNVCLLYLFLRLATGQPWRAAVAAALWGWHPLRVESVAWVGELKDVLCGLFWLSAMLAFLWYRQRPGPGRYAAVVGCMVAAALAKPMAVTLPFALLLLDVWPLGMGWSLGHPLDAPQGGAAAYRRWWRSRCLEQLPLLLFSVATACVTVVTQAETGATGSLQRFPVAVRLANAADAYRMYLAQSFWPTRLAMFYPHPALLGRTVPAWHWLVGLAVLVVVTAAVLRARRTRPYLAFGWLWFVGALVPVIGLVQVGWASRADRYTYLPSIGLTTAVVWTVAEAAAALPRRPIGSLTAGTLATAVALLAVTHNQVRFWHDDLALAVHANAVVADNFLARSTLAQLAAGDGRSAEAVRWGRSAVRLVPSLQETHHAYALALEADGQLSRSFDEFEQAIRIDPKDSYIRNDFGGLLLSMHRDADARAQFRRALRIDPDLFDAHLNLGTMLAADKDYSGAVTEFGRAVALNPRFGPGQGDLANALQMTGDVDGATEHYRLAVAHGDDRPDTCAQLAWLTAMDARSSPEDLASAARMARQACDDAAAGRQPFPWYAYSVVLARQGRFDDAISTARRALDLAQSMKLPAMAITIQSRIAAYQQGLPALPASDPPTAPLTRPAAPAPGR